MGCVVGSLNRWRINVLEVGDRVEIGQAHIQADAAAKLQPQGNKSIIQQMG